MDAEAVRVAKLAGRNFRKSRWVCGCDTEDLQHREHFLLLASTTPHSYVNNGSAYACQASSKLSTQLDAGKWYVKRGKSELTAAVLRIGGLHRLGQAARNTESRSRKLSRLTL